MPGKRGVNLHTHTASIDVPWRNFPSLLFGIKSEREVPRFLDLPNFLIIQCRIASMPKMNSIRSTVLIQYRLVMDKRTQRQTDRQAHDDN